MEYQYIIQAEMDIKGDEWYYTIWRRIKGADIFHSWDGGAMEDHGYTFDGIITEIMLFHDLEDEEIFAIIGA